MSERRDPLPEIPRSHRSRPGFGRVAEAVGGLTNLIGEADGPPMSPGYPLGDLISGLFGAMSVMVALYHRDLHSGEGQTIDLALYEAVFRLLDFDAIQFDQLGTVHRRTGNQIPYVAPSSTYRTRDGSYLTMAASTQSVWVRVCRAIGREDLVADPRFADNQSRVTHSDEINGIVADWIARHAREEVAERFERHEVAFSPIYDIADIFRDVHIRAREAMVRVGDPELGEAVMQDVVPRFSATPGSVDFLGPAAGRHNEEVYGGELGYSEEKLNELKALRVI